jgi:hypothetical protein
MATTHVPSTIPISVAAERLGVRNWMDRGLLDGYMTPTGRRKLRLTSVERLEREMFGFPAPAVELMDPTPAPPQSESSREYAQGKLP